MSYLQNDAIGLQTRPIDGAQLQTTAHLAYATSANKEHRHCESASK